jgi:hypothetical protein
LPVGSLGEDFFGVEPVALVFDFFLCLCWLFFFFLGAAWV